ncbi:transcription factor grauzone-like [Glossina fuscipes fuscipes]
MICRLCLKQVNEFKSAFEVTDNKPTMASIIKKHFWFELQQNDPVSTVICDDCWFKVFDFHEFYKTVEKAQCQLGENVVVKIENISAEHSIENVIIPSFSLSSKQEPGVNFDEVNDEVPFDMVATNDNTRADVRAEDSHDILGTQQGCTNNAIEDVKHVDVYKDDRFNDHIDDPFNKEVLAENEKNNKVSKKKKGVKSSEKPRTTRSSSKVQRDAQNIRSSKPAATKVRKIEKNRVKKVKKKELSEQAKAIREQGLAFDEEIAKFMSLRCELCSLEVKNFHDLESHMHAKHKVKGYARCCNKKFSKRFLLLDHIRQHSNPDCFKCDPCKRVFADRKSMRNHFLIKHQKDEDKMFSCSQCSKKFVRRYLLRQHELVGHSDHKNASLAVDEEIAKFMSLHCELCSVEIANFTALRNHMVAEHNIKGYVRCCNKKFSKRFLLLEHIRTHLNPACYKCENCSRVFPDRKSMRNHFLMKHQKDEDKTFACSQCPSKFVTVYLLQRHKVIAHRDRTNTCKSCNRRFSTGVLLSAHIKEQCLCDTCGEVVCNTAAFQRHLLRHKNCLSESKELRTCDICQKVSTSQQDMLAHKLCAHNPLRTYECNTSSMHDSFPFQYPYAITSQENASTMLAYSNHPYSVNRR